MHVARVRSKAAIGRTSMYVHVAVLLFEGRSFPEESEGDDKGGEAVGGLGGGTRGGDGLCLALSLNAENEPLAIGGTLTS